VRAGAPAFGLEQTDVVVWWGWKPWEGRLLELKEVDMIMSQLAMIGLLVSTFQAAADDELIL
jgi:hypothetical protein